MARRLIAWLHQFLLVGTTAAVYMGHRRVLKSGGYNVSRFFAACRLEFSARIVTRGTASRDRRHSLGHG
jgi:hypothetical protein